MKRKTNKALSVLLSAIMLVSVFTIALPETTSVQAETTGTNFTYSLDGDNAVITGYTGTEKDVIVPDTIDGHKITGIDEFAFFMNYGITSITLPESVESIGDYAFFHCTMLRDVTFQSDTLSFIGTSAFEGCKYISEITLPDSISEIEERAFLGCTSLKNVTTGKTVDKVGAYAFGYARNTSNWNYEKVSMTVNGYSGTAAETYCSEYGVTFNSVGQGNAASADSGKLPEEELDIPVLNFTDFNNYTDSDNSTLDIRDVISRNTKSYTANTTATYTDPETGLSFDVYANLKLQGNSSMSYPKKNFTVKFYADEAFDRKYKVELQDGWGKKNKYVLKANYMDHSHSRNVLGAKLWGQIVHSREDTYQQLLDAPNGGAIDGYPVKVYINGKYEGLYTLNVPKDGWQFAMGDGEKEALLGGESHEGSCNFTQPGRYDESDWTIEYPDPKKKDVTWVKNSFDNVINFVSKSDDQQFKELFSNYLDYDSCIDYYVYILFICGTDDWEKNMLMATYDGQQWFPSVYDMDSTFGIYWNGSHYNTIDWMLTHDYKGPDHGTNSLLWERVYNNFYDDIVARYAELRDTVLSEKNFIKTLNDYIGDIPKEAFDRDLEIYGGIPSSTTSDPNQIINYTLERIKYLDEQFGYETEQPDDPLKENLKETIDKANLIETDKYTATSVAYFQQELSYATDIYKSAVSTSDEILAAKKGLDKAMSLLISADNENCLDLAKIPQSSLTAVAASYQNGEDGSKAIDGNTTTIWHSNYSGGNMPVISENGTDNYITFTLNDENISNVAAISYLPRTDKNTNGVITQYKLMYSTEADGKNFVDIPGGNGIWADNKDEKLCIFSIPVEAKRIRLYATATLGEKPNRFISASEINLFTTDTTALNNAVQTASEIEPDGYKEESYNAMKSELEKAMEILSSPVAYQTAINNAFTDLNTAVENLEEAPSGITKEELKTLIDSSAAIDASVYTKVSRDALEKTFAEANNVYSDGSAAQDEINTVYENLKSAVDGLKYYLGDVNHSGKVTVTDATLTQLYITNSSVVEIDTALADLDNNSQIQIDDVSIIQKLAARIITSNDDGSVNL